MSGMQTDIRSMSPKIVASIDIGTNTTRLLIARLSAGDSLEKLYREHKITRLGEDIAVNGGVITKEAISRTSDTIRGFLDRCSRHEVSEIRAVATSAARSSVNGDELVDSIRQRTGLDAEIISGQREAYLTVSGILYAMKDRSANRYILDIGGGSTEFSIVEGMDIRNITSLEMGVLHLQRKYRLSPIPSDTEIKVMNNHICSVVREKVGEIIDKYRIPSPEIIATSGTPITLACITAGLDKYSSEEVEGYTITEDHIRELFGTLIKFTPDHRIRKFPALQKGREEIIIPGSLILMNILKITGLKKITVTENSLLEGVILEK